MLVTLLLISFGCGSPKVSNQASIAGSAPDMESIQEENGNPAHASLDLSSLEQKIIKNGEISLTVQDSSKAEGKILELVSQHQGLVQDTNTYLRKDVSNIDMTVRIPADKFVLFMDELKKLGEVTHSYIYTTDVTEEYIDLAARQKTLLVQEERLQEMLKKANNVEELLKVENELARVRGEIERITGRLNYLDNRIAFSTINIHLSTKHIPTKAETKNFGGEILFSFQDGLGFFVNFVVGIIKAAVWLLPFLVIIIPLAIFAKRKLSNRKNKE